MPDYTIPHPIFLMITLIFTLLSMPCLPSEAPTVTFPDVSSNIILNNQFSYILNLCLPPNMKEQVLQIYKTKGETLLLTIMLIISSLKLF